MELPADGRTYDVNMITRMGDILFYLAYFLILSAGVLTNVHFLSGYVAIAGNIAYAMLFLIFILRAHRSSHMNMAIKVIVLFALFASFYVSSELQVIKLYFLIIAFQGMDLGKFIRYDLMLKLLLIAVVLSFYFLGLTDTYYMVREGGQIRSSMGFAHPNAFGAMLLSLCIAIYYLKFEKLNFLYYLFFFAVSLVIRYFSDSRTSQLAIILLCIMHFVYKKTLGKIFTKKTVLFVISNSFLIFTVLSILLAYLYKIGNPYIIDLSKLLTGRIELMHLFMEEYDITLLGNKIEIVNAQSAVQTGRSFWVLDNGYLMLLLRYGIITYLILAVIIHNGIKKLFSNNNYACAIILFVFFIAGITETYFYTIIVNTFLLVFSNTTCDKINLKQVVADG